MTPNYRAIEKSKSLHICVYSLSLALTKLDVYQRQTLKLLNNLTYCLPKGILLLAAAVRLMIDKGKKY